MLPNSSEKVRHALRGKEQIENKTNKQKGPCGNKGWDLALISTIWEQTRLCHSYVYCENGETKEKKEQIKQTEEPNLGEAFCLFTSSGILVE